MWEWVQKWMSLFLKQTNFLFSHSTRVDSLRPGMWNTSITCERTSLPDDIYVYVHISTSSLVKQKLVVVVWMQQSIHSHQCKIMLIFLCPHVALGKLLYSVSYSGCSVRYLRLECLNWPLHWLIFLLENDKFMKYSMKNWTKHLIIFFKNKTVVLQIFSAIRKFLMNHHCIFPSKN